jgi:hypothetical protein
MKLSATRACVGAVVCLGIAAAMLLGERPPTVPEYRVPLVQDWTHRSLIYSAPRTILQNLQLQQQTRYAQQYLRRNVFFRGPIAPPIFDPVSILRRGSSPLQRDWGLIAGNGFTVGQGNFPAKYTFNNAAALNAASCVNDYVVFTTNQGAGLDIYAVNHLYVNAAGTGLCTGTAPTVLWAYHVQSNAGTSNTSPVLSLDGTQIAWVEGTAGGGGTAALHVLKPNVSGVGQGTIAAPTTPAASASGAAYHTCVTTTNGPCLLNLAFANGDDDSGAALNISPSSPFYDYGSGDIFVGDDGGNLHEFTGVFYGTPAEVTTGGWPVATMSMDATPDLGSPTYDETSQNAFVGNGSGRIMYVRTAAGSAGACNAGSHGGLPPCVGSTTFVDPDGAGAGVKISAAPIVDSTTQEVFVFFSPNGTNGETGQYVGQDDTKLTVAKQVTVNMGAGLSWRLNQGTLDNSYYTTDTGLGTGTGYLYACGNNGAGDQALLQRIKVTAGVLGNAVDATNWLASSASSRCSPLTEYYNTPNGSSTGAVDYLFFAVEASGSPAACGGAGAGCVFSLTITGGTLTVPPAVGTGAVNAIGTSGIIVDNDNTSVGAASIYFTWLVNGTGAPYDCNGAPLTGSVCAAKLTQLDLN